VHSLYVDSSEKKKKVVEPLEDFARACAQRPFDEEKVSVCREKLRAVGGDGLVIEASTTIGNFSCITKIVDTTGRVAKSDAHFFSYKLDSWMRKNFKCFFAE